MIKNYNKCKTRDYLLLGRADAWKKEVKKETINEIINAGANNYLGLLQRIRNYIIGYKIGKLEILLSKCEDIISFDFVLQEFTKLTENGIETTSFKKGYVTFQKEAKEEAKKLLKERELC